MTNIRTALVALLVALWAMPADAGARKDRQNRDNDNLTAKLGAKAEGWNWLQAASLDNYCHRVVDRLEDRAMRRLKEGDRYKWFFDRVDEIIDWDPKRRVFRRGRGEPAVGPNPCLRPGVQPGPQAEISKVPVARSGFSAAVSAAECNGCYRDNGAICILAKMTDKRIAETAAAITRSHATKKGEGDHGIGAVSRASQETIDACKESER